MNTFLTIPKYPLVVSAEVSRDTIDLEALAKEMKRSYSSNFTLLSGDPSGFFGVVKQIVIRHDGTFIFIRMMGDPIDTEYQYILFIPDDTKEKAGFLRTATEQESDEYHKEFIDFLKKMKKPA